jgi:hypothetical protein
MGAPRFRVSWSYSLLLSSKAATLSPRAATDQARNADVPTIIRCIHCTCRVNVWPILPVRSASVARPRMRICTRSSHPDRVSINADDRIGCWPRMNRICGSAGATAATTAAACIERSATRAISAPNARSRASSTTCGAHRLPGLARCGQGTVGPAGSPGATEG